MKRAGAVRRWLRFLAPSFGRLSLTPTRNPDQDRLRQRQAARQAFLSDLNPGQRALALHRFEDTQ